MLLLKSNRESILKPLNAVINIVERRNSLPILSNVLIIFSKSKKNNTNNK